MSSTPEPKQKISRAPGRRDLQGGRDAEELGEPLGDGPGESDRRRRPGDGHRVHLDRHAVPGEGDVDVQGAAVHLQRRGGSDHRRDARPGAEALEVAGERLADAQHGVHFSRAVHEGHVLGGLGEHGEVLGELALLERHVGRADLRPHDVELRQLVHERRALAQVLQRAGAALAGAEVEGLGDTAAGHEVEGLALGQQHVVGLGEAGHQDVPRALAGRPLDQLAGEAGDAGGVVYLGAALLQQRQDRGAGEAHAHAAEQLDRLVDDSPLLGFAQPGRVCLHRHLPRVLVASQPAGP